MTASSWVQKLRKGLISSVAIIGYLKCIVMVGHEKKQERITHTYEGKASNRNHL